MSKLILSIVFDIFVLVTLFAFSKHLHSLLQLFVTDCVDDSDSEESSEDDEEWDE